MADVARASKEVAKALKEDLLELAGTVAKDEDEEEVSGIAVGTIAEPFLKRRAM